MKRPANNTGREFVRYGFRGESALPSAEAIAAHDLAEALRVRAHFGRLRIERVVTEMLNEKLGPGWKR